MTNTANSQEFITPDEYANRLGVSGRKVRGWIDSNQLQAVNVSDGGKLPKWRISEAAIEAFERARSNNATRHQPAKRRQGIKATAPSRY